MSFATIPHTTVSNPYFKRAYCSWRRCPLCSGGLCKTWNHKKWAVQSLGIAMITQAKTYISCRRCPLGSGVSIKTWKPKKWVCCLWALQQYPTWLWVALISKRLIFPAGDALWVQGVSIKTWNPNKWVVLPKGFATIPHMTMSSSYFKRAYFSCRRCPLVSWGVH